MNAQLPLPAAVVVPSRVAPLKTETVAPASAVPWIKSDVSLVTPPFGTIPVYRGTSLTIAVMMGREGAVRSTVTV